MKACFSAGLLSFLEMDDIIILTSTKRKYVKAKKCLFEVLRRLKLRVAPHKTRIGVLGKGFHFLGINFEVSQNPQSKIQVLTVKLHTRTYRRALDKIAALREDAVHPANIQRYLIGWATWWYRTMGVSALALLAWSIGYVSASQPAQWITWTRTTLVRQPATFNKQTGKPSRCAFNNSARHTGIGGTAKC